LTRAIAFAEVYNMALRFREEFESLSEGERARQGEEFFTSLVESILIVCEETDEV
jgi:hypothetical protein